MESRSSTPGTNTVKTCEPGTFADPCNTSFNGSKGEVRDDDVLTSSVYDDAGAPVVNVAVYVSKAPEVGVTSADRMRARRHRAGVPGFGALPSSAVPTKSYEV
jgi:hypothetical protein